MRLRWGRRCPAGLANGNMHIVEITMELNIENVLVDPRDMIGKGSDVHPVTADDIYTRGSRR